MYAPLSRPIFIYVSTAAAERPEIQAFVQFYLENAPQLVAEVGYVALPDEAYSMGMRHLATRKAGSVFGGDKAKRAGMSLVDIMNL